MKVGLVGYGYTASFFAQALVRAGYEVWGTTRNKALLRYDVPTGVEIISFTRADIQQQMKDTAFLLVSVPPSDDGADPFLVLFKELLTTNKTPIQWIGYLSSTSVYGDHEGRWVNENAICAPMATRATNRLSVEKQWLSLYKSDDLPVMIFRLSGIYGPGRNALQRIREGKKTSVLKKGQYFSRIHIDDICSALHQSILTPLPGDIINLSDDCPCNSYHLDNFAADLLKLERPRLIPIQEASLSVMAQEFYKTNKRVDNNKLKKTLLPHLRYPTYKDGLKAINAEEG